MVISHFIMNFYVYPRTVFFSELAPKRVGLVQSRPHHHLIEI